MFKSKLMNFPKFKATIKIVKLGKMQLVWVLTPSDLSTTIPKIFWSDKKIMEYVKDAIVTKKGRSDSI